MSGYYHDCKTCGHYFVTDDHRCPPSFLVRDVDNKDNWDEAYTVYADNAQSAAIGGAEKIDDNGGEGPHKREVLVKDAEGNVTRWSISFDYSVDYYSDEVN